ncbi:hypothetical protein JKY79_02215 [Candidatus Babeliales bacterium]|nr:hypothetical protein [Candidatus Babeliales bacterium]
MKQKNISFTFLLLLLLLSTQNLSAAESAKSIEYSDKASNKLIYTIITGSPSMVEELLQNKANPNHQEVGTNAPIHHAIEKKVQ